MRFRTPELFLGCFLTIAVFSVGILFSSQYSRQPAQTQSSEKSAQAAENKSNPKGSWEGVATDPVAAFTLGIFLVGLAQAAFFYVQLKLIRESLTDAKLAAKAAERAAKATEDAVELSRQTAERQLRAYIFLDRIDLPGRNIPGTRDTQRKIKIAWKNSGGTRTRKFVAKVSHNVLDLTQQSLETFDFHDEPDAQTFRGLIGPNQSVNPPQIPVCDIHLVGDTDTALFIWGWAEYQDVFNDTIHRTEFAFRVWIDGDMSTNGVMWFEPTEKHNAADEDCMKPPTGAQSR
jgi:hypothetical protein